MTTEHSNLQPSAVFLERNQTQQEIVRGEVRTHLHNGTIIASIDTTKGSIQVMLVVHARRQLFLVSAQGYGGEVADDAAGGGGGEGGAALRWTFRPVQAVPPNMGLHGRFQGPVPPGYILNPPPSCTEAAASKKSPPLNESAGAGAPEGKGGSEGEGVGGGGGGGAIVNTGSCTQELLASSDGRGWTTQWGYITAYVGAGDSAGAGRRGAAGSHPGGTLDGASSSSSGWPSSTDGSAGGTGLLYVALTTDIPTTNDLKRTTRSATAAANVLTSAAALGDEQVLAEHTGR